MHESSDLSHTGRHTHTLCKHTQAHDEYTQICSPPCTQMLSQSHTPCQINNKGLLLLCYRRLSVSLSFLLCTPTLSPFHFLSPYFPTSPLVLSSSSPADESAEQLLPLKWPGLAPSHWFSSRERGAEVLGERAGDERSYVEGGGAEGTGRDGWGFNWKDKKKIEVLGGGKPRSGPRS